jgi:NADH-quinone oxidoreductase subunit N
MNEFVFLEHLPAIIPEVGLTILAVIVLGLDLYLPESRRRNVAYVTGIGLALLAITPLLFGPPDSENLLFWGGMVRHDVLSQVFKTMVLIAGAITALMSTGATGLGRKGEFYLIIIVATLGACLMSAASDLIMVFVALEATTIPLYILAGFLRGDKRSSESSMKYFLFGSFTSAFLLYGFSLLYGFTGQTNLYAISEYLGSPEFVASPLPVLATMLLILVGFGFKISAVPFHFWTPDVYEGAPTPVTAYVSVASKAASFALLLRLFVAVFPLELTVAGVEIQLFWVQLMAVLAVISMTLGNVVALAQKNIKRLLAYSSIAQAGYTLIGLAAVGANPATAEMTQQFSVAAIAFYMFMYTFTNLLAFTVVLLFSEATGSETIADFAGLSRRNPMMALAMTIALLSLAGIPPAAGFFGKFFLFQAAVAADLSWLAVIGVLNAIVALYYYLMVIKIMYVDRSEDEDKPIPINTTYAWVLGVASVVVIILGTVGAQAVFDWAANGAAALFAG